VKELLALYVCSGMLLCCLSIPLIRSRVPPNGVYGFRVPATLRSPELWYPANRCAGKWLLMAGAVVTLVAGLLYLVPGISLDGYAMAELVVVVVTLTAAVTASLLCLRALQRKSQ
jgi:uncharacterized membrane protein